MERQLADWPPTSKRFVAFLDIMGFTDMVLRTPHHAVRRKLEKFVPSIGAISYVYENIRAKTPPGKRQNVKKELSGDKGNWEVPTIKVIMFSDSILLISKNDSFWCAQEILFNTSWVLTQGVFHEIPMKGAIAYGTFTADFERSLHFGIPLIDAYLLQEDILLYGAVLHHTMERHLHDTKILQQLDNKLLYKYPVPMRTGRVNHYILELLTPLLKDKPKDKLLELQKKVSGAPRIYVDHTIEFFEWLDKQRHE